MYWVQCTLDYIRMTIYSTMAHRIKSQLWKFIGNRARHKIVSRRKHSQSIFIFAKLEIGIPESTFYLQPHVHAHTCMSLSVRFFYWVLVSKRTETKRIFQINDIVKPNRCVCLPYEFNVHTHTLVYAYLRYDCVDVCVCFLGCLCILTTNLALRL